MTLIWLSRLCLLCIAVAVALMSFTTFSKPIDIQNTPPETFTGILGDQDEYSFQIKEGEWVIVSIEQINADAKVKLTRSKNNTLIDIFEIGTSADVWLDEVLYVDSTYCKHCSIKVLPQAQIDQSGTYHLTIRKLQTVDNNLQNAMKLSNQANIAWQLGLTNPEEYTEHLSNALSFYQQVIVLAEPLEDLNLLLRSLFLASKTAHELADHKLQRSYLLALIKYSEQTDSPLIVRTQFELAKLALGDKQLVKAEHELIQLQSAVQSKNNRMHATISHMLAKVHIQQGEYQDAILYVNKSISIYQQLRDWRGLIICTAELGWIDMQRGYSELAEHHFLQALALANKTQHVEFAREMYVQLGYLSRVKGQIDIANHYIDKALENSNISNNRVINGRAKQEKARIKMEVGQFELANDYFTEAYQDYQAVEAKVDMVNIEYFLSTIHSQLGNFQSALGYALRVLEHDKSTGVSHDIGTAYNRLAGIYLGLSQYTKSLEAQQLAIENLAQSENALTLSNTYSQAAEIFFHNQLYQQSQLYFDKADRAFAQNDHFFAKANMLFRYAKTQHLQDKNTKAVETLERLVNQLVQAQHDISRPDLQRSYLALQQKIANLYIDVLYALDSDPKKMLQLSESFRGLTLDAKIQEQQVPKVSEEQQTKLQKLHNALQGQVINYSQLSDVASRNEIAKSTRQLVNKIQQVAANTSAQRQSFNSSYSLLKTAHFDIEALQRNLAEDSLILYFDTAEPNSHIWSISSDNINYARLPKQSFIEEKIDKYITPIKLLLSNRQLNKLAPKFTNTSELTKLLLGPLNIQWEKYNKLIVIPDGPLYSLPFSLLENNEDNTPLVESVSISYLHSLNAFQLLNHDHNQKIEENNILIVANPSMEKNTGSYRSSIQAEFSTRGGFDSNELPHTQYEADAIKKIMTNQSTLLVKEQASKQQLLNLNLSQFQLIHFATHGISYSHTPSLAGLVLSNLGTENNLLLAPEISQLSIPADLVVLSGCDTAKGKLVSGEGQMGLSRAFFEAGAKSVIASLWQVQDKATAELMKQFYYYLIDQQLPTAQALQKAKLDTRNYRKKSGRNPWRHPYYWAGFVLQGA